MTTKTIQTDTTLSVIRCGKCGMQFAMPDFIVEDRRATGETFYCPNGHPRAFVESDLKKAEKRASSLEAQLVQARDQAQAARADADSARRSTSAVKGQLTRERKRTAAGTCPCCKRTFQQLTRHMQGQHPAYVAEHQAGGAASS